MADEKDLKIVEMLMENARTPFTKIAKELGVSESLIRKRVKKLEDRGVIKKYAAIADNRKIGFDVDALIGIDVEPERYLEAVEKLKALQGIKSIATSSGDHGIMIEVWKKDMAELRKFVSEDIESIIGVTRVCPAILLEKIKGC
ncbi:MAG: Lrp/AsnC family transcriptional regulator [Candidatus Diapherotrites archaeon]|nr:Lrp/AsnC family transcriptional regulator [Candidatus Micrarchaeota archaeon]MBU1940041.1 Lrp/AsnC family transcriptional regulator [Candidatus Micrarchaeota archaeon]